MLFNPFPTLRKPRRVGHSALSGFGLLSFASQTVDCTQDDNLPSDAGESTRADR